MGKMLEALKQGESRRSATPVSKPEPQAPGQDCVVDWEIGAEVPYVEVGGPDKKVELSPSLLVKHPAQTPQPPHAKPVPPEAPKASPSPKAVTLTEAPPMLVALESYPEKAIPTSITREVIVFHDPDHPASKEYAQLLDKMLAALKSPHARVILLVGFKPQVGASTVLLNLAGVAARQGQRAIVVDANCGRPGLAQRLGQSGDTGLSEVLEGTVALDQAIVPTAIPSLHLLPAGVTTEVQEYLTAEAMTWLIGLLRDRFDLILIDGPALSEQGETAVQVPHADAVYLVVPRGEQASAHRGTAQAISRMGGRLCGLIHTHFEM